MNVKLSKQQKIQVLNSTDLYHIMQQVLLRENKIGRSREHFWVVCLNGTNQILLIELMGLGGSSSVVAKPTDVFSFGLQKQASKLILVHNHPAGGLKPSPTDRDITERLWAIGDFVNMPVIEHLIITEKDYLSFVDEGLLEVIAKERKYDLNFTAVGELLEEIKEIKEQQRKQHELLRKAVEKAAKAKLEEKIEIAVKMLSEKEPLAKIIKFTGLSKAQVEGLRKK